RSWVALGAARGAARTPGVRRASGARAGTRFRRIALAGRGATCRSRIASRMLTSRARSVALIERARVAIRGAARAQKTSQVRRTSGYQAGTRFRRIALAGRGATLHARVAGRMLASRAASIALIERARIAIACTRGAGRTPGVRRASGARAGTRFRRIALAGRGATLHARVAGRVRASRARSVALIECAWIAIACTRGAGRTPGVRRASDARAGTGFRRIALAGRGATLHA